MKMLVRVALAALFVAPPVAAQFVNDQTQPYPNYYFWGPYPLLQSFQPDSSYSVGAGAVVIGLDWDLGEEWDIAYDGSTVEFTINLWDNLPNLPGATKLAGGSVVGVADKYFDLVHWSPVAVTPGATYFLEFVLAADGRFAACACGSNDYLKGSAWSGDPDDPSAPYQESAGWDFTFLTFAPRSPAESTVPEPATMVLLATGLAALGASRRR